MSWRRGRGTVQVELANVQSKIEDWSDDLDGEGGVIQSFRTEATERAAFIKFVKAALWVGGLIVGLPAFALSVIEVVKIISGR